VLTCDPEVCALDDPGQREPRRPAVVYELVAESDVDAMREFVGWAGDAVLAMVGGIAHAVDATVNAGT
jgi:hypothetical protein